VKKIILLLICTAFTFNSYGQKNSLSDAEKVLGLSICWSEAKYNFVYFDRLTLDWDSLYLATIPVVLATENDFEYYRELQRFVAQLQDGHTSAWMSQDLWNSWAPVPIRTRLIDGKMIVTEVLNDELEQLRGIKQGFEIVKINGIDVHEYVSIYVKPYIHSSTEQWLNFVAYGRMATRGKKTESIRLTFKDDNNRFFESEISHSMPENNSQEWSLFEFSTLENNIGLLKINSFIHDDYFVLFDSIYEKILTTDALIIDIRVNGGGTTNNAAYILSHFTNETFRIFDNWSSPRYIPAYASWNRPREWYVGDWQVYQPIRNKPIYNKPIAVLIGEGTLSTAEDFCVGFRNINSGFIIGTPSGGSTGNPIEFSLPGGGGVQICTVKAYPDGTGYVGIGILPDIKVRETISSFFAKTESGTDNTNAVRKAIEVIKKQYQRPN
jgi:C-terminal processing protease CtpA/Prc